MSVKGTILTVVAGAMVFLVLPGTACHKSARTGSMTPGEGQETVASPETSGDSIMRAGALAWSQNCMRCHNLRNPRERSDREWEAIAFHMRVRANLTAEEHRLILRFLQSAN